MKLDEMTLDVEQHVEIKADIGDVFFKAGVGQVALGGSLW